MSVVLDPSVGMAVSLKENKTLADIRTLLKREDGWCVFENEGGNVDDHERDWFVDSR